MKIKSLFRKAIGGLASLAFSLNLGCGNPNYCPVNESIGDIPAFDMPRESADESPRESVARQSVKILGGFLASKILHESSHALTASANGFPECEIGFLPSITPAGFRMAYTHYSVEDYARIRSDKETAAKVAIAGPLSDILLAEIIDYNLRNGNVSPERQKFLAAASLASRIDLLVNSIRGATEQGYNDFNEISYSMGLTTDKSLALIIGYTALNFRNIKNDVRALMGKANFPTYRTSKGRFSFIPTSEQVALIYEYGF